jgi:hypothetical protein
MLSVVKAALPNAGAVAAIRKVNDPLAAWT